MNNDDNKCEAIAAGDEQRARHLRRTMVMCKHSLSRIKSDRSQLSKIRLPVGKLVGLLQHLREEDQGEADAIRVDAEQAFKLLTRTSGSARNAILRPCPHILCVCRSVFYTLTLIALRTTTLYCTLRAVLVVCISCKKTLP